MIESQTTRKPLHIAALDGVRGLAVLMVFSCHYAGGVHSSHLAMQIFGKLNKGGWSGVVLFFVLSGFLITGILWDSYEDPHWWQTVENAVCLVVAAVLSVLFAVISFHLYEKPFLRLKKYFVPASV